MIFNFFAMKWVLCVIFLQMILHSSISATYTSKNETARIAICTVIKNEGRYLLEWIVFHKLVGFNLIILHDDNSTDNTKEIVKPFVNSGLVIFKQIDKEFQIQNYQKMWEKQLWGYSLCVEFLENMGKSSLLPTYLGIFDIDEVVFPCNGGNIRKNLKDIIPPYQKTFLECARFGLGPVRQENDTIMAWEITTHVKRAPVNDWGENEQLAREIDKCTDNNICPGRCCDKWIYRLDLLFPNPSGFTMHSGPGRAIDATNANEISNRGSICCNHYSLRNLPHLKEKGFKNGNNNYNKLYELYGNGTASYFHTITDDMIIRHYGKRLEKLLRNRQ